MNKKSFIVLIVFIVIGVQGYRIVSSSGMLKEVQPVALKCLPVTGPTGAEDITIDQRNGFAYISADDRRAFLMGTAGSSKENGGIWGLDLKQAKALPVRLTGSFSGKLHPHGISLLALPNGEAELYAVNHLDATHHEILVFHVDSNHQLTLKNKITFPEMISPNDLVAVAPNQFFMTNDHGNPRHSLMETLEDYLGLPLANVVFYDGSQAEVVLSGFRMANGITTNPARDRLFIAETTGRRVTQFKKTGDIRRWEKVGSLNVDTGVDNLEWDQKGRLLSGAHPDLFAFLAHMKDPASYSPSHVIRMSFAGSPADWSYETLYMNNGEEISGSSVAASYQGNLLIGPVFQRHFLRCDLP